MTLQETCLKLQGIAHDGHALGGVYVMVEGRIHPAVRVYRDGDKIIINGCCGKCRQGEEDGKK